MILASHEEHTVKAVSDALELVSPGSDLKICKEIHKLRAELPDLSEGEQDFRVVIVDIDHDPKPVLHELGRLTAGFPGTPFVVVSQDFDEQTVLHSMQVGARHFMRKNAIADEMGHMLQRLRDHHHQANMSLGELVSVFSCGGGCGATTVTINLAHELQKLAGKPTLIVDLDLHYGAIASYLNLEAKYGVAHLLSRGEDIDRHLVESVCIHYKEGVDVLVSPISEKHVNMDFMHDFTYLPAVLEFCRELYGFIIVDAPRLPLDIQIDLAFNSRIVVPVFQLLVRQIDFAAQMVARFTEAELIKGRIVPVANQMLRRRSQLSLADASQAINLEAIYSLRNDWKRTVHAENQAKPLCDLFPRSGIRRDNKRFAREVHNLMIKES